MDWNHTWQKYFLQGSFQVLLLFVPTVLRSRWLLLLKIEISLIGGAVGHNFERDHPCQLWFNLVQRFLRRFKCDLLSKYA
jgi:hypothetical protein